MAKKKTKKLRRLSQISSQEGSENEDATNDHEVMMPRHPHESTDRALEGNQSYRNFVDKLAESNVDEYVDLPMIAVMGDTSSGKS